MRQIYRMGKCFHSHFELCAVLTNLATAFAAHENTRSGDDNEDGCVMELKAKKMKKG